MGINKNQKGPVMKAFSVTLGLSLMLFCGTSSAATDQDLLNMCKACHGKDGSSEFPSIPNLKWQNAAYMVQQLEQFKTGQRQDKTMTKVANLLTTEQMKAMADHFNQGKEE